MVGKQTAALLARFSYISGLCCSVIPARGCSSGSSPTPRAPGCFMLSVRPGSRDPTPELALPPNPDPLCRSGLLPQHPPNSAGEMQRLGLSLAVNPVPSVPPGIQGMARPHPSPPESTEPPAAAQTFALSLVLAVWWSFSLGRQNFSSFLLSEGLCGACPSGGSCWGPSRGVREVGERPGSAVAAGPGGNPRSRAGY